MGPSRRRRRVSAGAEVLLAERLHGVREWSLQVDDREELRLSGFGARLWESGGAPTTARCEPVARRGDRGHSAPAPAADCDCGLYALHPWAVGEEYWRRWTRGSRALAVVGFVEAWGTVRLHREGFRAQYARPCALVVAGDPASAYAGLVARLAAAHAAVLLCVRDLAELAERCAERNLGLDRAGVERLLRLERPEARDSTPS